MCGCGSNHWSTGSLSGTYPISFTPEVSLAWSCASSHSCCRLQSPQPCRTEASTSPHSSHALTSPTPWPWWGCSTQGWALALSFLGLWSVMHLSIACSPLGAGGGKPEEEVWLGNIFTQCLFALLKNSSGKCLSHSAAKKSRPGEVKSSFKFLFDKHRVGGGPGPSEAKPSFVWAWAGCF